MGFMRPMPATLAPASHEIIEDGDKIIVRDVDLFCSFDAEIDGATGDERCAQLKPGDIEAMVKRTQSFMRRGQFPRIVCRHDSEDRGASPESVGRVPSLRYELRGDIGYAVGDMEYSRADFDRLVRTNAYPRRSPEVWKDGYMSEVALLGRDTPRRPLHDTHFEREGDSDYWRRPGRARRFEMGTGGGPNTFVPGTSDTKPKERNLMDELTRLQAEHDDLKAKYASLVAERDADKAKHKRELDDKDRFARETATDLTQQVAALRNEVRKAQFERDLDAMEKAGYTGVKEHRAKLLDALEASSDPAATLGLWRETFAKAPIGVRLPAKESYAAAGARESDDPEVVQAAVSRAQAECGGDVSKFQQLVEKYKRER